MNTLLTQSGALCLLFALLLTALPVSAKETSQNFVVNQTLNYFWNRWNGNININLQPEATVIQQSNQSGGAGWEAALANPNVTILYRARVVNNATGALVTDGATVPIGTVLRLEFEPHLSTDISWFGTGYSMDSPYGEWRTGAAAPALTQQTRGGAPAPFPTCEAKDFVNSVHPFGIPLSIYIPLVVNPPAKSITTSSNLSCGAPDGSGNRTCTVTAAGPISVSFDFAATYGKFFYRYTDQRTVAGAPSWAAGPGCYGNNVALRPAGTNAYIQQAQPVCWTECVEITCVPDPDYFNYGNSGTYQGGGAGGGCFSADTLITMADGSKKPIAEVSVGDRVLSEDPDTGERGISTVTDTLVHDGAYGMFLINGTMSVTPEHEVKILRDGKALWVSAGRVAVGDSFIGEDGSLVPITSVEAGDVLKTVYNLTTVPHHTYFAGGVLVHNIKGDGFYMNEN